MSGQLKGLQNALQEQKFLKSAFQVKETYDVITPYQQAQQQQISVVSGCSLLSLDVSVPPYVGVVIVEAIQPVQAIPHKIAAVKKII